MKMYLKKIPFISEVGSFLTSMIDGAGRFFSGMVSWVEGSWLEEAMIFQCSLIVWAKCTP